MRKADEGDEVVAARFRSVLTGARAPSASPVPGAEVSPAADPAESFADRSPVAWSELIPSWPDDVEIESDPAAPAGGRPFVRAAEAAAHPAWGPAPIDPSAWTTPEGAAEPDEPASAPPAAPPLSGAGAFGSGGGRLGAFDPGRRGVKALAAVAVVVVLIAGFLAWRSRPRVDPVAAPPVADAPLTEPSTEAAPAATGQVVVAVEGKVAKPGVVTLPAGSRVADALAAAGGAKRGVDTAMLNLARKVVDGELILVGIAPSPGMAAPAGGGGPAGAAPGGPVNLNTATLADLDTLPGVGPVLAQRILDARTAKGGFGAVADLREVEGIGNARYEQLKDLVTV